MQLKAVLMTGMSRPALYMRIMSRAVVEGDAEMRRMIAFIRQKMWPDKVGE